MPLHRSGELSEMPARAEAIRIAAEANLPVEIFPPQISVHPLGQTHENVVRPIHTRARLRLDIPADIIPTRPVANARGFPLPPWVRRWRSPEIA